ncbi:uncharacterized protein LTR77_002410 [Saxophila tyrrhenica]|uniref:Uncharacterized protein n=1 Tax=Saxophila tyrrhenica TaxID=1690608 RepID=A0AAV9PII8_9PEZI|nr:hypothetical protein LTR77_002410 [Saxophila tyrrhenica]
MLLHYTLASLLFSTLLQVQALAVERRQDASSDVGPYISQIRTALYVIASTKADNTSASCADSSLPAMLDSEGYYGTYAHQLLCETAIGIQIWPDIDQASDDLTATLEDLYSVQSGGTAAARADSCRAINLATLDQAGLDGSGMQDVVCGDTAAEPSTTLWSRDIFVSADKSLYDYIVAGDIHASHYFIIGSDTISSVYTADLCDTKCQYLTGRQRQYEQSASLIRALFFDVHFYLSQFFDNRNTRVWNRGRLPTALKPDCAPIKQLNGLFKYRFRSPPDHQRSHIQSTEQQLRTTSGNRHFLHNHDLHPWFAPLLLKLLPKQSKHHDHDNYLHNDRYHLHHHYRRRWAKHLSAPGLRRFAAWTMALDGRVAAVSLWTGLSVAEAYWFGGEADRSDDEWWGIWSARDCITK